MLHSRLRRGSAEATVTNARSRAPPSPTCPLDRP